MAVYSLLVCLHTCVRACVCMHVCVSPGFVCSCSPSMQPPLQDAAAVFLSDATSLKHTDLLSQKSELLIRHALFVAGFFGWNLLLLEGG